MKMFLLILSAMVFLTACQSTTAPKKYSGFGASSLTPQQLVTFAPPPPSAELKNQIEKLVDLRSSSPGLITSDGKQLFVNWNVTGSNQVWKLQGPKSFPEQLTGGEDPTQLVGLSPNNQWLVISRDSKGDENPGIYLMSTKGGLLKKIYYNSKHQTSFLGFTEDSQSLYYQTNDKTPDSYSIYKYSLKTQAPELIWDKPGIWSLSDIKGNLAILTLAKGSMQNEHYVLDLTTKTSTPLIGQNELEDYDVMFTNQKDEYLVLTNKPSEYRRLYTLKKGQLTPWSPELANDISDAKLSYQRNYLLYTLNKNGYSQLKLAHLETKKTIDLPGLAQAQQSYPGSFSYNEQFVTYAGEFHNSPRKNYVYSIKTKKAQEWVLSSTPEIDTTHFVKPTLETYKSQDGTDIPMFVWRSEKCKTEVCPVIVQFHGGPESQFIPRFSPIANLYTEHGFIFVAPNVRGSDGYGKSWLRADNGAHRLKVITDIRDCADYIKKTWAKNGKVPKVGITGGSYGGYSTLVGASMFADSYDAALAIVGMSSLISFIENTAPYRRALRMNEYGDPAKDREVMLKLSPITYVEKVTKPLMIAHGASDPRVPVGEAVQFYEIVHKKNKDSQLVIFPDEGHGVAKRPNIVLLQTYMLDFFEKHLKQQVSQ